MRSVEIRELRTAADMHGLSQEFAALLAELDTLKATLHDEIDENLRLRDLGGARQDEGMTAFIERLIAERDALAKDAARWRTFIGLPYETRARWVSNLSLVPVLRQWVDEAGDAAARVAAREAGNE